MTHDDVEDAAVAAARECDACLVVGTSAVVQPAANVAMLVARGGAALVEVNAEATSLSAAARWTLRARAGEPLPRRLA